MTYGLSEPTIPTPQDAALAQEASQALALHAGGEALRVQLAAAGHETTTLDLPPVVTRLLLNILTEMAAGNAVTLVPVKTEITTQQAATLLNVSRPFVIGLIDKGILPVRMVGNHRRLSLAEVLAYKADNFAKRSEALREMAALDQQLGLI